MSVANEQITQIRALDLNRKEVSAALTVRTGRPADGFVIDNPVDVTASSSYVVTVPSGYKMGQTLLLVCSSRSSTYEVSVSITNHETTDPEILYLNAVDEYIYLIWTGTEWATISTTASTSSGG
jgi:hypothetical protein